MIVKVPATHEYLHWRMPHPHPNPLPPRRERECSLAPLAGRGLGGGDSRRLIFLCYSTSTDEDSRNDEDRSIHRAAISGADASRGCGLWRVQRSPKPDRKSAGISP